MSFSNHNCRLPTKVFTLWRCPQFSYREVPMYIIPTIVLYCIVLCIITTTIPRSKHFFHGFVSVSPLNIASCPSTFPTTSSFNYWYRNQYHRMRVNQVTTCVKAVQLSWSLSITYPISVYISKADTVGEVITRKLKLKAINERHGSHHPNLSSDPTL